MKQLHVAELIRRYVDAYNRLDINSMLELLHEEILFQNVSGGVVNAKTVRKAEFEALAGRSAKLFKARTQTVKSIEVQDEKASVAIDFSAMLAVDMPNGLKAGDTVSLQGRSEFSFKDGLIWSIIDES